MIQKAIVLMPERMSEFIQALAVATCKSSDSDVELTLVVQERFLPLCSILCLMKVVSFKRDSKKELESFISLMQVERFYKLYNCSQSHVAAWIAKKLDVSIKRGFDQSTLKSTFTYEDLSTKVDSSIGVPKDYTQFLEVPLVDVGQFDISFSKIKRRLKRIIKPDTNQMMHLSHDYARILEMFEFSPELWSGYAIEHDPEYAGMIALCPGAEKAAGRRWPYFRDLVRLLPSQEFVIIGSEREKEVAKTIAPHLPHRVRNLAGKIPIEKSVSILAGASTVISNDSGFLQLSGFIGVRSIGIYGSSSPLRTRPLGMNSTIVFLNKECSPCTREVCNKMDNSCMAKIEVDRIINLLYLLSSDSVAR